MDIDLQWGGFYACRESDAKPGEYGLIRILDFNRDAYHAALYQERFDQIPSIESVQDLHPFIGHVPIDARGLLNYEELILIGGPVLTEDDLVGYRIYLENHEVPNSEIDKLVIKLADFGKDKPLKLRLSLVNNELMIQER
ncbi:MAG: hypothetical protein KDC71_16920 [Acidobacteria bacterium]|nr:hypothetical protein [Acidobacteriota bacterium]